MELTTVLQRRNSFCDTELYSLKLCILDHQDIMIAILAWSSLIWKPQKLAYRGTWKTGGPILPLEFSRVTEIRPLTLVLDPQSGVACPTRFAMSAHNQLSDAIADLQSREDAPDECVGYLDLQQNLSSCQKYPEQINVEGIIRNWCHENQISAAIWTALPPNFADCIGVEFSVDTAIDYLKHLPQSEQARALEYFQKTPAEINTPLREKVAMEWSI